MAALLETYSVCSSLLKRLKRYSTKRPAPEEASRLRKQLRSDKTQVSTAYVKQVARRGAIFGKGDGKLPTVLCLALFEMFLIVTSAKALFSLRHLRQRLVDAIESTIRVLKGDDKQSLDYASLVSLSTLSRREAIDTMSLLSRRISQRRPRRSTLKASPSKGVSPKGPRNSKTTDSTSYSKSLSRNLATHANTGRQSWAWSRSSDSTKIGEVTRPKRTSKAKHHKISYPYCPGDNYSEEKSRRSWWNPLRR